MRILFNSNEAGEKHESPISTISNASTFSISITEQGTNELLPTLSVLIFGQYFKEKRSASMKLFFPITTLSNSLNPVMFTVVT